MSWFIAGFITLTILSAFFFGILGFKIVLALFGGTGRHGGPWHHRRAADALAILAERYARGEIDEVEFKTRKAVLSEDFR